MDARNVPETDLTSAIVNRIIRASDDVSDSEATNLSLAFLVATSIDCNCIDDRLECGERAYMVYMGNRVNRTAWKELKAFCTDIRAAWEEAASQIIPF